MFYRKEADHLEAEQSIHRREQLLRLLQIVLLIIFAASFAKLYSGPYPWNKSVIQQITKVAPELEHPKSATQFSNWLHSEVDHPKMLRAKEHATIGLWYGAAFALIASFLLLITTRWWLPHAEHEGIEETSVDDAGAENAGDTGFAKLISLGPLFYLFLIGAMAAAVWFRAPALDHSLWNDEEYAMRRFAHGAWENKTFEPVTWTDTLFENHNGNNHLLHSCLSRLSLSAWHALNPKADPSEFSEVAARMPSMIAGLLTIVLIALLGRELGAPWIGVGAAWFIALHPWHVRYATEAKGYSLMLFFVCLCLFGLVRAMRHHRPGDWLLFAVGEAGFLLSFAGSIYLAVTINLIALVEFLVRRQPRHAAALIAFNLLAAIPVVIWTLPSVPQLIGFIQHDNSPRLEANTGWLDDLACHLGSGIMDNNLDSDLHSGLSWQILKAADPLTMSALGWGLLGLATLGLSLATFSSEATRVAILAPALAGALSFWHASVQRHPNLAMYYIYLLIPLALACALAVVRLRLAPVVLVMVLVTGFGFATQQPRSMYTTRDRQPIRQTVAAIREKKPEALTGTFGVSDRQAQSYDPQVRLLAKPEDVDALLAQGQSENRPVFIYFAGLKETAKRSPELLQRVAQSPDFVPFKEEKGLEAMFSYMIYAHTGIK